MSLRKICLGLAALAGLAGVYLYWQGGGGPKPEGTYLCYDFNDAQYLTIKQDALGNPHIVQPANAPWRIVRNNGGGYLMLYRPIAENKQPSSDFSFLPTLVTDPETGVPRTCVKYCVLIPSATVPGDWDISEATPDSLRKAPMKLNRPLPSALHRVTEERLPDLIDQTIAVRKQEWTNTPGSDNWVGLKQPPQANHEALLSQAAALARAHPGDPWLEIVYLDALHAARDFKTLEREAGQWRPRFQAPSFLRVPFRRAEWTAHAWKMSMAGKNAYDLDLALNAPQAGLEARIRLMDGMLDCEATATPFVSLWGGILPGIELKQTNAKVLGVIIPEFLLLSGRRDEALRLLAANYRLGQFLTRDSALITQLVGIAVRGIVLRGLELYAMNACESPQELQKMWATLEKLNPLEPPPLNPVNLGQAFSTMYRTEPIANFWPEWRDAFPSGWSDFGPNWLEPATRANVANAKFQVLRQAITAKGQRLPQLALPGGIYEVVMFKTDKPPEDPFGNGSPNMNDTPESIVCYSVGPDKVDDRGTITYDPSNGTLSRGDIIIEVPTKRKYPFPAGGVRGNTREEVLGQFPNGLPADPYSEPTWWQPLSISASTPVYIYSAGPHSAGYPQPGVRPEIAYDPTNGTLSQGNLFMEVPGR